MTDPTPAESILNTIKQMLLIGVSDTAFDLNVTVNINSAFANLYQLGIGPFTTPYRITGANNLWTEFTGTEEAPGSLALDSVKDYIYQYVKMVFDPPPTSFAQQAMQAQVDKLAWMLNVQQEGIRHPWPVAQA